MAYDFPSLDGTGWVKDPRIKIDSIFAAYMATDHSQTVLYRNFISSFSKDIQVSANQWSMLPTLVKDNLGRMFSSYFDSVDIDVSLDENSMNASTNQFLLVVSGTVIQDGITYDISKELQRNSTKTTSITDFKSENIVYQENYNG